MRRSAWESPPTASRSLGIPRAQHTRPGAPRGGWENGTLFLSPNWLPLRWRLRQLLMLGGQVELSGAFIVIRQGLMAGAMPWVVMDRQT